MKTPQILMTLLFATGAMAQNHPSSVQHRNGSDALVLSAYYNKQWSPSHYPSMRTRYPVDYNRCQVIQRSGDLYQLDCTREAFRAYRQGGGTATAVVGQILFNAYKDQHSGQWRSTSGLCEVVEIRTIIKKKVFDDFNFQGLGFWTSVRGLQHVNKSQLFPRFNVTLKNGEKGSVYGVITQGACFGLGGNGGSLQRRFIEFKPFAHYIIPHQYGRVPRYVWEGVSNFRLGRSKDGKGWIPRFDRKGELVKWFF